MKRKTVVLNSPKTPDSSDLFIPINSRIKTLAKMVDEMNNGKKKFSLEDFIQQLDALLIQLQKNGGKPLCRKKIDQ